ncbi:MAG TPA: class I SAM-dependent methyltransferase, partial [Aestuariivirga sp.]|nr:class I SAM-dependent methyltransferase [Aestuariivirga sp.]
GRTGALAEMLAKAGALVLHTDPFLPNVEYARARRGLPSQVLKLTEVNTLANIEAGSFDVVIALSVHLLAHVLSPRDTLEKIRTVLKPGGLLFLDEKDIGYPVRYKSGSIYSSGRAHLFHFTVETVAASLETAGYEIVSCELDKSRSTGFRHIKLVARNPVDRGVPAIKRHVVQPKNILTKLRHAERKKWAILVKKAIRRSLKQLTKARRAR